MSSFLLPSSLTSVLRSPMQRLLTPLTAAPAAASDGKQMERHHYFFSSEQCCSLVQLLLSSSMRSYLRSLAIDHMYLSSRRPQWFHSNLKVWSDGLELSMVCRSPLCYSQALLVPQLLLVLPLTSSVLPLLVTIRLSQRLSGEKRLLGQSTSTGDGQ